MTVKDIDKLKDARPFEFQFTYTRTKSASESND